MISLFVPEKLPETALCILLTHLENSRSSLLFQSLENNRIDHLFGITSNPEEADFVLLPHDYRLVGVKKDYLNFVVGVANDHQKKILVIAYNDSSKEIDLPNAIILRTSKYKTTLKENEFIIPPIVDDLLSGSVVSVRHKSKKPVIGFVGWGAFSSLKQKLKIVSRGLAIDAQAVFSFDKNIEARKPGLLFRRKAIKVLLPSEKVVANFVVRKTFSGNVKTIELDPALARKEYIKNTVNSDFILCSRGDGNYSMRFYEALSAGRVPVLIDTDLALPLENKIDYDNFVLRVPMSGIGSVDSIVADFYSKISDQEFTAMQLAARQTFENHLNFESFFRIIFEEVLPKQI